MEKNIAIHINGLSKVYNLYKHPKDFLIETFLRKQRSYNHWALRDINFDVYKGEVVGIIGRNGAGKSTLLRIIAGTLNKTSGIVELHGRVSALMALGTGFNLELSGRENILMGGLCLGMTHKEIHAKTEEIIEFSGIRTFIDSPCRTYSSGMLARLAFSVAAHVNPDILIVDEALATGDMLFMSKSYARMREIAKSGATVLLVSHSMQQVYDMCHRAIYLEDGRIVMSGEPKEVGAAYEEKLYAEINATAGRQDIVVEKAINEQKTEIPFYIKSVYITDSENQNTILLKGDKEYAINFDIEFTKVEKTGTLYFEIKSMMGSVLYGTNTFVQNILVQGESESKNTYTFTFSCKLNSGVYYIKATTGSMIGDLKDDNHVIVYQSLENALLFNVENQKIFSGYYDMMFTCNKKDI